ncbi:hypothetical protein COCSADRAFT_341816 [Bipolaris sorokiniana ND90Pr]|uniref:Uncharacterized protein n=1 Tax=Cochliobolus sativus (strain ND90Pr / ATCC 201652) TaxID=665912 RepID=M2SR74_COCSN|nr:uncharacterized protein COCSADRAFT_341816 [Bipolaris sorokiniana ND90Pr]EMD69758.1 hypothetical protein COCSADRAFT_341816 [Bipolaris sorokiniana ND90Pr]
MAHDSPSNALNPDAPAFSPSSSPSQQASNQHQWNFRVLQIPYIHEGTSYFTYPPLILLPPPSLQQPSQPLPPQPLPPQPPSQLPSQPLPLQAYDGHNSSSSSSSSSNHSNGNGNGYSSNSYNSPYQTGPTTPHNNLYAHFTNANTAIPFPYAQTTALSSNGYHHFHFHNNYNYTNSHYSNNFPSSNLYPTDYSNLGLFSAFSSQMNQVEGIQNSFHGQRSATNGHGGVWQQQPTKDRGKKSKRNKRKKHGKCKGKKKGDANGDELGSDQINGDGAGGDDVNGDEANGGGSNGGEANGDGTRDGDTPSENEWKFEEEET